jgi:hypothetical protein
MEMGVVVISLTRQYAPMVESCGVGLGPVAQVPFANESGLVSRGLQPFRDGVLRPVKSIMQGPNPVHVVVSARQYAGSRRRAYGIGAVHPVAADARLGDTVQVGRGIDATSVAGHRVRGVVIGQNEQDVRALVGHVYTSFHRGEMHRVPMDSDIVDDKGSETYPNRKG